jgi:hypothetical protein
VSIPALEISASTRARAEAIEVSVGGLSMSAAELVYRASAGSQIATGGGRDERIQETGEG